MTQLRFLVSRRSVIQAACICALLAAAVAPAWSGAPSPAERAGFIVGDDEDCGEGADATDLFTRGIICPVVNEGATATYEAGLPAYQREALASVRSQAEPHVLVSTVGESGSASWNAKGLLTSGAATARQISAVRATISGRGGVPLGVVTQRTNYILRAGEVAPFELHSQIPRDLVRSVTWETLSTEVPNASFEAILYRQWGQGERDPVNEVIYVEPHASSQPYVAVGRVANNSEITLEDPVVTVAWVNLDGTPLHVTTTALKIVEDLTLERILPGEIGLWVVTIPDPSLVRDLRGTEIVVIPGGTL